MVFMNAIVEIDKAGRIVVPKKLRDDLHLIPGTRLRIERSGSGDRLTLMPCSIAAQLVIENGVPLIFPADSSNPPILTNEMVTELIEQGRLERKRRILSLDEDSAGGSAWNEGAA
ncbi:MAG: AbrB/MazE/SpoVT family DNA-binding domain-containing protein [Terracidiphilus sp.]|jgi:AbrB family looped-hinge helix DNA binding protein